MPLTPAKTDPKRAEELKRRKSDPVSFGIGNAKSKKVAAKRAEEADAAK